MMEITKHLKNINYIEAKMSLVDFELRKKLQEAFSSGKFMMTISYIDGDKIQHYTATKDFPRDDILKTFEKLIQDMAKEIPVAGVKND